VLCEAERVRLAGLHVPKRRSEWVAGRRAAKAVVAAALAAERPGGFAPGELEIRSEASGMPFAALAREAKAAGPFAPGARLPVSVSISHWGGWTLCAAARDAPGGPRRTVGIDLGQVEPRSPAFVSTFLADDEQRLVAAAPAGERDLRVNVVWCAKEAALKALGLGLTVDTYAVRCLPEPGRADLDAWCLDPADGGWHPLAIACEPALVAGGERVRGIWRALDGGLLAALAVREAPARGEQAGAPVTRGPRALRP
jgi:4'-phosphopantetheinyl transferase